MALLNLVTPLHTATKRDYLERMIRDKIQCMDVAKKYDQEFWDGDRKFGYGGYRYDGRWKAVAEGLIDQYQLKGPVNILDVGCGKGFLLYELAQLLPEAEVVGFDISEYAIGASKEEIRGGLFIHNANTPLAFNDNHFDLVISLGTLHNLPLMDLAISLSEIERVARNKYIMVEAYRNNAELFNLQCWALTCESFLRPEEWAWFFGECGYRGDYEFIYFE